MATNDLETLFNNTSLPKNDILKMRYSCGSIPSDIWMYHIGFSQILQEKLKNAFKIGQMNHIDKWPKFGDIFGFIKDDEFFRGKILSSKLPFSIRDMDTGKEFLVDFFDLFTLPQNLKCIYPQAIHCTLDSEEREVCQHFGKEFLRNIIYDVDLIVTIKNELKEGFYLVEIERVHPINQSKTKLIDLLRRIKEARISCDNKDIELNSDKREFFLNFDTLKKPKDFVNPNENISFKETHKNNNEEGIKKNLIENKVEINIKNKEKEENKKKQANIENSSSLYSKKSENSSFSFSNKASEGEYESPTVHKNSLNYNEVCEEKLNNFNNLWPDPEYLYKAQPGQIFLAMISEIISPAQIYFHKVNDETSEIDLLTNRIDKFYNNFQFNFKNIFHMKNVLNYDASPTKTLCAAPFKGIYYRAKVIDIIPKDKVKVLFVDYGNIDILDYNDIKPLLDEFAKIPFYAEPLALYGIESSKGWTEKDVELLESFIRSENMTFILTMKSNHQVELTSSDGENINFLFSAKIQKLNEITNSNLKNEVIANSKIKKEVLFTGSFERISTNSFLCYACYFGNICKSCPCNSRKLFKSLNILVASVYIGQVAKVKILNFIENGYFYVSLLDFTLQNVNLESLMREIKRSDLKQFDESPVPGHMVLAYYEEEYHRAVITKVNENQIHLFLLDLGKSLETNTTTIRVLEDKWKNFPAQSILCSLANAEIYKDRVSLQQFKHLCLKEMEVRFLFPESENCSFPVLLYTNQHQDIGIELIRSLSAKPREYEAISYDSF